MSVSNILVCLQDNLDCCLLFCSILQDGPFLFAGQTCPHLEAVNKAETAWHTSIYEPSIAACRDSTVVDEAVWQSHPFLLKLR